MTQVKVSINNVEFVRFTVNSFFDLKEKIAEYLITRIYSSKDQIESVLYRYKDFEQDWVEFSSEEEWELAKKHVGKKIEELQVRVTVEKVEFLSKKHVESIRKRVTELKQNFCDPWKDVIFGFKQFICEFPWKELCSYSEKESEEQSKNEFGWVCIGICRFCLIFFAIPLFLIVLSWVFNDFENQRDSQQSNTVLEKLNTLSEQLKKYHGDPVLDGDCVLDGNSMFKNKLMNGESLNAGEMLYSNGYYLVVQDDCNVVIYNGKPFEPKNAIWSTRTNYDELICQYCSLKMDSTNNLILHVPDNIVMWRSGTNGFGEEGRGYLELREDGSLAVVTQFKIKDVKK